MTKVLLDTDKAAVIEAVSGATVTDAGTPASDDKVLIQDTSDSDNLKYVNIADLPGGGVDVLSNVATDSIIGRTTAGSGDSEELTASATRTFLNVEDDADKTDTANVEAAGALMDSEVTNLAEVKAFDSTDYAAALGTDDNYVTDAEKTVIGNTSGTNTGDQDLSALAPKANPTFTGEIGIGSVNVSETELGILEGATLTTAELNYVDGVTSAIQTQIDAIGVPGWETKTSSFTPAVGGRYIQDATSGITVTLPTSHSAGDTIEFLNVGTNTLFVYVPSGHTFLDDTTEYNSRAQMSAEHSHLKLISNGDDLWLAITDTDTIFLNAGGP